MALNTAQQIFQAIKGSQQSLITFRKNFSVDSAASALALFLIIKKMDKLSEISAQDFLAPKNLGFLPNVEIIKSQLENIQKYIISLDLTNNNLDQFSYNIENDKLNIYLSPSGGAIDFSTLKTSKSKYRHDLIFTVDTPDLESLGALYQNNRDFFYETTIINIDNHPENENFGQINLINPSAVAASEIIFDILESFGGELLDPEIATCILTGMIAKTNSFKTANVTPKSLNIASQLIAAKAERQEIIKNLFRSQSLTNLNLWGRALARLKNDLDERLVWTILSENDFIEAQAEKKNLDGMLEELAESLPKTEVVILFIQQGDEIFVNTNVIKNNNALKLTSEFSPSGSKLSAEFSLKNKNLAEAAREVLDIVREKMKAGAGV